MAYNGHPYHGISYYNSQPLISQNKQIKMGITVESSGAQLMGPHYKLKQSRLPHQMVSEDTAAPVVREIQSKSFFRMTTPLHQVSSSIPTAPKVNSIQRTIHGPLAPGQSSETLYTTTARKRISKSLNSRRACPGTEDHGQWPRQRKRSPV